MLKIAIPYEDEINKLVMSHWYDPEYQFYFGGYSRHLPRLRPADQGYPIRSFASIKSDSSGKERLIGFFVYSIDTELKLALNFGMMSFTDDFSDKIIFGNDLSQLIDDIFVKFGLKTMEFAVICGNPIERSYDRVVEKLGGRSFRRSNRAFAMNGDLVDDKIYEVTRYQYMAHRPKRFCNDS